jgi:hypothetical protein
LTARGKDYDALENFKSAWIKFGGAANFTLSWKTLERPSKLYGESDKVWRPVKLYGGPANLTASWLKFAGTPNFTAAWIRFDAPPNFTASRQTLWRARKLYDVLDKV